jgi:hypothetical protein
MLCAVSDIFCLDFNGLPQGLSARRYRFALGTVARFGCPTDVQYTDADTRGQVRDGDAQYVDFIWLTANGHGPPRIRLCFFHGGNTGSIPVGRATQNQHNARPASAY